MQYLATEPPAARARVLIVVSSLQLRSAIRQTLQMLRPDCQCLEAASGEEALGVCHAQRFDVVLLDLHLPGISAFETTRRVKQVCPSCHVVLLVEPYEAAWLSFDPLHGASGSLCKDLLFEQIGLLLPKYLPGSDGERGEDVAGALSHGPH